MSWAEEVSSYEAGVDEVEANRGLVWAGYMKLMDEVTGKEEELGIVKNPYVIK